MKYDKLLDRTGFPGPVTPQEPQNRVRQTYRGLPGAGLGCHDCAPPPVGMGALPAGAFAGAIGLMLAGLDGGRFVTPGTLTPDIAEAAGLSKGGQHHHGGHHRHHGGRGRGGAWWGPVGYDTGDTYIVESRDPCPNGYVWDDRNLRCVKLPPIVLRGLYGLGSTATDWCTALRTGAAAASSFASLCDRISDPVAKSVCQASFRAAQAGVSTGCAHVDDPSGGTLPPASYASQAKAFTDQMNASATTPYFQPAAAPKSFVETTGGKVAIGVGVAAVLGLAYVALRR